MDLGLENRKNVLTVSLMMEGMTSVFLAGLLNIKKHETSKSFGNTSSSLSFNQKINLLIDLGALAPESIAKFKAFMEIRNQFMHNLEAVSYSKCFEYIGSSSTYLIKQYARKDTAVTEKVLKAVTDDLSSDVWNLTTSLINKLKNKFADDVRAKVTGESMKALSRSIFDTKKQMGELIDEVIKKHEKISTKELHELNDMFVNLTFKNFSKRLKEDRPAKNAAETTNNLPEDAER